MRIAVCIKQVPAGTKTVMDPEKGLLLRLEADTRMNPYDLSAIEGALQIADATGGRVTALSMGPLSAEKVLREAMAMGVDEGILLTDRAFSGADVYATSHTLACGIEKAGGFDCIVCGQQTTDGDTAQVPFSLAARLNISVVGWIREIESISKESTRLLQEISGGTQVVEVPFPVCLAISKDALVPRLPSLAGRLSAKSKPLTVWGIGDMDDKNPENYGLKVSPTRVRKVYAIQKDFKAEPVREPAADLVKRLLAEVEKAGGRANNDG